MKTRFTERSARKSLPEFDPALIFNMNAFSEISAGFNSPKQLMFTIVP